MLSNPLQLDYVVYFLAVGLSFRHILQVVTENRDQLGCAVNTGCVSEGKAPCFSRIVCAVGMQVLADVIGQAWAFTVGSDVSTNDFSSSHLNVRV